MRTMNVITHLTTSTAVSLVMDFDDEDDTKMEVSEL